MIAKHSFILEPGEWVGEGTVAFSSGEKELYFITQWGIDLSEEDEIECSQQVRMEGALETVVNSFQIYDVTSKSFNITLENELLGKVSGTGIIDDTTIAWEFRGHIGFQGFEVYKLEGEGLYKFHAEYTSPDHSRTIIDGHIRKTDEEE